MREYISSKAALICPAAFFISLFADRLTKYAALRLGWNTSLNAGLSFGLFSETGSSVVTAASAVDIIDSLCTLRALAGAAFPSRRRFYARRGRR